MSASTYYCDVETILANLSGGTVVPQRRELNGRTYRVAPFVGIVPGVLEGSQGPLLYTNEETSRDPGAWNGMPVTADHPVDNDGQPCSGRSPEVLDRVGLGTVFGSVFNGRLAGEVWLDEVEAPRKLMRNHGAIGSQVWNDFLAGKPLEISTGLYTDNDPTPGTYKGRSYTHVARNHRPDHLALLVGKRGACSVPDGCGLNLNEEVANAFCATGEGGGVDSSCSGGSDGSGSGAAPKPITSSVIKNVLGEVGGELSKSGTETQHMQGSKLGERVSAPSAGFKVSKSLDGKSFEVKWKVGSTYSRTAAEKADAVMAKTEEALKKAGYSVVKWGSGLKVSNPPTSNAAGAYGNPKSANTGKFKPHGSGFGKGDVYDAALKGAMQLREDDWAMGAQAREASDAGVPYAVTDETTWERAKAAADKGNHDDESYWAVVSYIYRKMGGTAQSQLADNQDQETTMPMTKEQREGAIKHLATNCECWKGGEGVLANLADDRLAALRKAVDTHVENANVVNGIREALGEKGKTLAVNAMPAFIKAKIDAKEEDGEEEPVDNADMCPECGSEMVDGACPDCAAAKPAAKTPVPAANSQMTEAQWLARQPKAIRDRFLAMNERDKYAQRVLNAEKRKIVDKLVANVARTDPDRAKMIGNKLMKNTIEDLQERLELVPVDNQHGGSDEYQLPNYGVGGFPMATLNESDREDVLDFEEARKGYAHNQAV